MEEAGRELVRAANTGLCVCNYILATRERAEGFGRVVRVFACTTRAMSLCRRCTSLFCWYAVSARESLLFGPPKATDRMRHQARPLSWRKLGTQIRRLGTSSGNSDSHLIFREH